MKVIDDGVIKYDRTNFTQSGPIDLVDYSELEYWRKKLFKLNLIGEYPIEKIGFGNLSEIKDYTHLHKTSLPQFIITGTQTGKLPELNGQFYTRVLDFDIDHLKLKSVGPVEPSSEALTHAAIYAHNKKIKAIFHVHSPEIWKGMIEDQSANTAADISYGTIEMAKAIQKCIEQRNFGTFCMKGHTDGIVFYGPTLQMTGDLLLKSYKKYFFR
jgi:ribulose-5-phosphate 4-epimerase/fuculose-1-phosphate aldolase